MLSVAIIGRPNVGKSRLFNRLIGKRVSIVHDMPGVTRDIVMEEVDDHFVVMDTGGIGMKPSEMSPEEINSATEEQVGFAIQAAELILFVVDGKVGLTQLDYDIAEKLRTYGKKTILVVNKIDTDDHEAQMTNFYALGFKQVIHVSAEHGRNEDLLLKAIKENVGPKPEVEKTEETKRIKICLAGRPNVGKSSLINSLLKQDRLIVNDMPGTTRESINIKMDYQDKDGKTIPFQLIDTAGRRAKTSIRTSVEYFSGLRTEESVLSADIVFIVINALEGVTRLDKNLAGDVLKSGRGLVILVNKWDYVKEKFRSDLIPGYQNEDEFKRAFIEAMQKEFFFLPDSPIIFVSAKEGLAVDNILEQANKVYKRMNRKLSTSKINLLIEKLMKKQKPKMISGKKFKIYYGTQAGNYPFKIKMFCNLKIQMEDSYRRYLEKGFIEEFKLKGCPIVFHFIGKLEMKQGAVDSR